MYKSNRLDNSGSGGAYRGLSVTIGLICVGLLFLLTGCASLATDYRKEGFSITQRGFAQIDSTPNLNEVIEVKNVKVHIVGNRKYFDYDKAAVDGSAIAGYANTNNEISLFGKVVDGKIVVNQVILGHEFNHILQFNNPIVADPDRLDELGA